MTVRTIWTMALALAALACTATADAHEVEAEYLRLRPQKEPTACDPKIAKCVAAPRINKRISTIPGVRNPDFGKPHVPVLQPNTRKYGSPYRSFGGNRGITGGM